MKAKIAEGEPSEKDKRVFRKLYEKAKHPPEKKRKKPQKKPKKRMQVETAAKPGWKV